MYKEDLALNNLEWLIWYKTKPNQNNVNIRKEEKHIADKENHSWK